METLEFEVHGALPPKLPSKGSIWTDDTEAKRVIKLRQEAYKHFKGKKPLLSEIKLDIDIYTQRPEFHKKKGDLDNFIKGICDSLYNPLSSLSNPNFLIHEDFKRPENKNIRPIIFSIITDDFDIIEINARMNFIESDEPHYRIRIEGLSGEK